MATTKEKKPVKLTHEVRLIVKDKVFIGKGTSTFEALKKINEPKDIKSYGTFEVVIDGKLSVLPRRMFPTKIKRLFANEWELELLAKQIEILA